MNSNKEQKMKNYKFLNKIFIAASLVCVNSLSFAGVNADTQTAVNQLGAGDAKEINFKAGSAVLTPTLQKDLKNFVLEARKKGAIANVKIAAWADQEYPPEGRKVAASQKDLAEKRAKNVEGYIENHLNVSSVSTMNMAERPTSLQRAINTQTSEVKDAMENTGAAPTSDAQTGLFDLKGKASHALVLVYYN